jgi:hypothetical protein
LRVYIRMAFCQLDPIEERGGLARSLSKNSSRWGTRGILTLGNESGILTTPVATLCTGVVFDKSRGGGTFFPALDLVPALSGLE